MAKGGQERLAKVAELGLNEDKVARERSGKGTAGRGHSQCRDTEAGTSQGHSRRVSPGNGGGDRLEEEPGQRTQAVQARSGHCLGSRGRPGSGSQEAT